MDVFGPATKAWFEAAFASPTPVQQRGWAAIAAGEHALLIAPTGSGKTLAAFLWAIDQLLDSGNDGELGVRTLYVSPLKALVYDVERNLRAPLIGIGRAAERLEARIRLPRVAVRTGDTSSKERRQQLKEPGEILVTTPESLYLLLGSQARETLRTVQTVIIDEVHALAPTKRGAHLAVSLERLTALVTERAPAREPQRIGLSATAQPLTEVARYLGGDRQVTVVDASAPPALELQIVVPVADMTRPEESYQAPRGADAAASEAVDDGSDSSLEGGRSLLLASGERGMWPAIHPRLLALVREHRTTIIFVNSRGLCERLTQRLNELAEQELVRSHHGSLAHGERRQIEEALKSGQIRAIVATSSLELGIDMGTVDLVVLVESPGSVASGLQRVGRAGHGVGQVSKGRLFPKHRGDLLEAAVVSKRMRAGLIEPLRVPQNPLDVLAQQLVATVAVEPWPVERLRRMVMRAANFAQLPDSAFVGVLDMLAGRYPSNAFAELRPRLNWDRQTDVVTGRQGAKMVALTSGGTIPDRGTYSVHLGDEHGSRVGELDEEMVHETTPGQTFTLGASTWRVERITRDRVIVSPAPGEVGKLPFWRGDGPGRPIELGRAMGAFLRALDEKDDSEALAELEADYGLDAMAADNLLGYVREQRDAAGVLPTDRTIVIERFRDELGDWRVCILTPFGARIHAPWALALEARLSAQTGFYVQTLWSDDGIVLRFVDADELPELDVLLPDPDEVEELVVEHLASSALFAGQFRENAARALLMPRRRPGERTPLWVQRLKSQQLLAIAREYPAFPIIMESYRSCLQDVFDLPALTALLNDVRSRAVRVESVQTTAASPFARSLVFAYVSAYLYEGDQPLAERKAQALSLDRALLRELLGQEELRELLDASVIEELENQLQHRAEDRQARHEDGLHDVLRRVGDLTAEEVTMRVAADVGAIDLLERLQRERRAVRMRIGGQERWIAIEDAGIYRDALGASPPAGVAEAFLQPHPTPFEELLLRWARTHGPFATAAVAERYQLPPAQLTALFTALEQRGALVRGAFRPGHSGEEWCEPEVLRRIKRRTLARLRSEVAPVDKAILGRFLPEWHGLDSPGRGMRRLQEVLVQLEGLPLSYRELETILLPARVSDFAPRMLDELGAMGWLVWIGHGALGARDGKVALYRREQVASLLAPPAVPEGLEPLHERLLEHLQTRGASFFVALQSAADARTEEVLAALWDLVWAGLVTNDTFGPLRVQGRTQKATGRARARQTSHLASGRWSLVAELLLAAPNPTAIAHARAIKLLERHGVVSREVASLESLPGGFSAVYAVLKAMEEAGKVRRGYFVDGLGGAQFAFPGAVDRLRAVRTSPDAPPTMRLSAVDPANPYGWLISWPDNAASDSALRRAAGATVVLVGGEPVLYVDTSGRKLVTFAGARNRDWLVAAASALRPVALRKRGKMLRIDTIDGEPALASPHAEALRAAAFFSDHRGLVLEAR